MRNDMQHWRWLARSAALVSGLLLLLAWQLPRPCAAADEEANAKKPAASASRSKATRPSVDDALLEDLDNELLEGVGNLKSRGEKKPAESQPPDKESPQQSEEGEDVGMPSAEDDPLGYISQEMRTVEKLIPHRNKQAHAQQLQQRIMEDLAKLIEQAERQRAAQQSSQKRNKQQAKAREKVQQPRSAAGEADSRSNKPAADSTNRLGRAEDVRPDPELIKGLLKQAWGHLPDRAREQMRQDPPERFLPQYELLIERYYRRLAEEQPGK